MRVRRSTFCGAAAMLLLQAGFSLDAIAELESELLFEVSAALAEPLQIGQTPAGNRIIVYVTGGAFLGPELKGEVLPGGGDWLTVGRDGVSRLDVRATLRTDDGALIYVRYPGVLDASPNVRQRMAEGEEVDSDEYYFRTTPIFETSAEKYLWLNRIVAVGVGRLTPDGVAYTVYTVK